MTYKKEFTHWKTVKQKEFNILAILSPKIVHEKNKKILRKEKSERGSQNLLIRELRRMKGTMLTSFFIRKKEKKKFLRFFLITKTTYDTLSFLI